MLSFPHRHLVEREDNRGRELIWIGKKKRKLRWIKERDRELRDEAALSSLSTGLDLPSPAQDPKNEGSGVKAT